MEIEKSDLKFLLSGAVEAYNNVPNPGMSGLEIWRDSFRENGYYEAARRIYEIIELWNLNSQLRIFALGDLEVKMISEKLLSQ